MALPGDFKVPALPRPGAGQQQSDTTGSRGGEETPATTPTTASSSSGPLAYSPPAWSAPLQDECYLEVIKGGTVLELTPPLTKAITTIGKLPTSDLPMEHPSISRHHALLQCSRDRVYLLDHSTHGSRVNGRAVPSHKLVELQPGDALQFGGSSRVYVLVRPAWEREQRERELEALEPEDTGARPAPIPLAPVSTSPAEAGTSWSMGKVDEGEGEPQTPHHITTPDPTYYRDDPKKALRILCHQQGLDPPEAEVHRDEEQAMFVATLTLDVEDVRYAGTGTGMGKRAAEVEAALDLCARLDEEGLLRAHLMSQTALQSAPKRRFKVDRGGEAEEELDSFYDVAGSQAAAARKAAVAAATAMPKVETAATLAAQRQALLQEIARLQAHIVALPPVGGAGSPGAQSGDADEEEEELDHLLHALQQKEREAEMAKLMKRMADLRADLDRVVGLLRVVAPEVLLAAASARAPPRPPRPTSPLRAASPPGPSPSAPKRAKHYRATPRAQAEQDARVEGGQEPVDWVASSERKDAAEISALNASYGY